MRSKSIIYHLFSQRLIPLWVTFTIFLFGFFLFSFAPAQAVFIDSLTGKPKGDDGLVNDFGELISTQLERQLEKDLTAYWHSDNGLIIEVISEASLSGKTAPEVAELYYQDWLTVKPDLSDGLIFLISQTEQTAYVRRGNKAQERLSDEVINYILKEDVQPEIDKVNFEAAVDKGVNNIIVALNDPEAYADINRNYTLEFFSYLGQLAAIVLSAIGFTLWFAWYGNKHKTKWLGIVAGAVIGFGLSGIFSALALATIGWTSKFIFKK